MTFFEPQFQSSMQRQQVTEWGQLRENRRNTAINLEISLLHCLSNIITCLIIAFILKNSPPIFCTIEKQIDEVTGTKDLESN